MKSMAMLYCQHSLGMGHLVRSLTLAEALRDRFELAFLNGGPVPANLPLPPGIRFEHLAPLRMDETGQLIGDGAVDEILARRRDRMLALARELRPRLLVVELYPFGRKKFASELDPLIAAVREGGGKVVSSVRDILVGERVDQARHDERAVQCLNRAFDAVLVHADASLTKLSDTFRPATAPTIPIFHTGFVARRTEASPCNPDGPTLVTAGGGIVGQALYHAAIEAQRTWWNRRRWPMVVVAGPMFPQADWAALGAAASGVAGLGLLCSAPSLVPLLREAGRVVSQCGYNSALEIARSGRPALFVPFARGQESEQTARARQLSGLGLCDWLAEDGLSGKALARRLLDLAPPQAVRPLDFDGAARSAELLGKLAA